MKKYNFGQFVELLQSLQYKEYKSELHQIGEILEIFDKEWDGESHSDKFPVELAKWIQEKGIDNFVILLNGFEISEWKLGGDGVLDIVRTVLSDAIGGKYKFFYAWYGECAHAVAIGSIFQLGDDLKEMVEFNTNKVYAEDETLGHDQVQEEHYVGDNTISYAYDGGVETEEVCDSHIQFIVNIVYEQYGELDDDQIKDIMGTSDSAGTFIGSETPSRDMQWYYNELPIKKIEDLRELFRKTNADGEITIGKTEAG